MTVSLRDFGGGRFEQNLAAETPGAAREIPVVLAGEGIVLKERTSLYRPWVRSPAWIKLKPKLSLDVVVTSGSGERIRWGDMGETMMLELRSTHWRTGATGRSARAFFMDAVGAESPQHQPSRVAQSVRRAPS